MLRPRVGWGHVRRSFRGFSSKLLDAESVIIIGGGHAGCEAAAAAARCGARVKLVTQRIDTIGELSCNPSVGGIGKGHLVREIDALDGIIGEIADHSGIHFKMLNQRKGPAVQGPRMQVDRDIYKARMIDMLRSKYSEIEIMEESVEDLLLLPSKEGVGGELADRVALQGIITKSGKHIFGSKVIITTGTFLRGTVHIGREKIPAGRHMRRVVAGPSGGPAGGELKPIDTVEPPSIGLAKTLERLNFPMGRLKTGTPPRLLRSSIDWTVSLQILLCPDMSCAIVAYSVLTFVEA